MKKRTCAAFLFDGFADCELALAMAAINQPGDFVLETFSNRGRAVTARSGLQVLPHTNLAGMRPDDFDILLLPGGDQWEKGDNLEIFPLIKATLGRRVVVAVGSATLALADLGVLDSIPHTGGGPGYFRRYCPEYAGEALYRRQACIQAGGVITIDSRFQPVFDTLQEIYLNDHELHDPAC
ncbi:DJ-1/PfpI family protein [Puia sp.]|jgi:putative intracellular protease/amidase|uniref:DJ-1/PfpI family protein n=1 Tax=Puia sp. TaxID=2045100 RepID=UPI002F3EBD48